jgi:hypothetical protein
MQAGPNTHINYKKMFVPLSIQRPLKELEHIPMGLERYNLSKYYSILLKKILRSFNYKLLGYFYIELFINIEVFIYI